MNINKLLLSTLLLTAPLYSHNTTSSDPQFSHLDISVGKNCSNKSCSSQFFELCEEEEECAGRCPTGPAGPRGPTGRQGGMGSIGPTGQQGFTGPMGHTGPTGPNGPRGLNGFIGAGGVTGATGRNGFNGATGNSGFTGFTGATGATGVLSSSFLMAYNNTPAGQTLPGGSTANIEFPVVGVAQGITATNFMGTNDAFLIHDPGVYLIKWIYIANWVGNTGAVLEVDLRMMNNNGGPFFYPPPVNQLFDIPANESFINFTLSGTQMVRFNGTESISFNIDTTRHAASATGTLFIVFPVVNFTKIAD